jgi:very-short-patch-repair endonuclease
VNPINQNKTPRKSVRQRPPSAGEESLALQLRASGIKFFREHRFDPVRRWKFDFAMPEQMIAVEVEGGTFTSGRHSRGAGYERDCEKYAEAAIAGWRVIRATTAQAKSGTALEWVKRMMGQ